MSTRSRGLHTPTGQSKLASKLKLGRVLTFHSRRYYSQSADINLYFHLVAQKGGIVPHMKLSHTIRGAVFNEVTSTWMLSVENGAGVVFEHEVDVYVPANGVLRSVSFRSKRCHHSVLNLVRSQVNRPNIKGIETFTKNPVLHTAEWDKSIDYKTAFKDEKV